MLPYKKLIAWSKSIKSSKKWKKEFKNFYGNKMKVIRVASDIKGSDVRDILNIFAETKNNIILICVNMCQEGSDYPDADCGIYLDYIKKRSILVALQSSGRITRPDKHNKKSRAYIIDTFKVNNKHTREMMTMKKLFEYYKSIWNMTNNIESINKIKQMIQLYDSIKIDTNKSTICIATDNNKENSTIFNFDFVNHTINWDIVKLQLRNKIQQFIKLKTGAKIMIFY